MFINFINKFMEIEKEMVIILDFHQKLKFVKKK
jgi:hypothetical protein